MEVLQISSKELISYAETKKNLTKHNQHRPAYYIKNKQKYILAKQKYRAKLKANKHKKLPSPFQQNKLKQFLKLLVNNRSFVPVPRKLKHPLIKNWNASNYFYNQKLNLNNLPRGCVRIIPDNWNNSTIIWLDIDQPKWTKLAKQLRCGYITSPKKHIRIPVPVKDLQGKKTGTLYYQGEKIGDAKLTGEVMLPGQAYYNKEGKFLGYYEYKAWGTFFPLNNKIWENTTEFFDFLKQISEVEYKSIREHFSYAKVIDKVIDYQPLFKETTFIPSREPPGRGLNGLNSLSKATNY